MGRTWIHPRAATPRRIALPPPLASSTQARPRSSADKLGHDRESESGARTGGAPVAREPLVRLPDSLPLRQRHPRSLILHHESGDAVGGLHSHPHGLSLGTVLDRVLEQVPEDLHQGVAVGLDPDPHRSSARRGVTFRAALERDQRITGLGDHVAQRQRTHRQRLRCPSHAGELEHVVHQVGEPERFAADDLAGALLFRRRLEALSASSSLMTRIWVSGRAQLVRHTRHEIVPQSRELLFPSKQEQRAGAEHEREAEQRADLRQS